MFGTRLANCDMSLQVMESRSIMAKTDNILALSPTPLYSQIREILRKRILDGTYQPHQQMPSESELIKAFSVSRITVRQALGDLQRPEWARQGRQRGDDQRVPGDGDEHEGRQGAEESVRKPR